VALTALVAVGAAAWIAHLLLGSHWLAVTNLVVHGNKRLTTRDVQTLLDGMSGQNLLRVDLADYRRRLMESHWVADATLTRVLPSTVEIRIVERAPMAVARSGQQLFLVDDAGAVIDEFGPQYRDFDLPLVDGLVRTSSKTGDATVNAEGAALTGRFLDALRGQPELRGRVSQIDVTNGRDVVALLTDSPILLHLGDDQFIERLTTYLEVAPTLAQQFKDIDFVDLRYGEKVVVGAHGRAAAAVSKVSR